MAIWSKSAIPLVGPLPLPAPLPDRAWASRRRFPRRRGEVRPSPVPSCSGWRASASRCGWRPGRGPASVQPPGQRGPDEQAQQRADSRVANRLGLRRLVGEGRRLLERLGLPGRPGGVALDGLDPRGQLLDLSQLGVAVGQEHCVRRLLLELASQLGQLPLELPLPALGGGGLPLREQGRLPGRLLTEGAQDRVGQRGRLLRGGVQDPDGDHVGVPGRLYRQPLLQLLAGEPVADEGDGPVQHHRRAQELGLAADDAARVGLFAGGVQEHPDGALVAHRLGRGQDVGGQGAGQHESSHQPAVAPNRFEEAGSLLLPTLKWAVQRSP